MYHYNYQRMRKPADQGERGEREMGKKRRLDKENDVNRGSEKKTQQRRIKR